MDGKTTRALKSEIIEAVKSGFVTLPPGDTLSHIQSWTMHKCIAFMSSHGMVPDPFHYDGAKFFRPSSGTAVEMEAAAVQLARALTKVDELSEKIDGMKQQLDAIADTLGRRPT